MGRGWTLMIFCARATRGLGRPSLDARNGRSVSPHPLRENEQAWKDQSLVARLRPCWTAFLSFLMGHLTRAGIG
jgi:hypothetical protein